MGARRIRVAGHRARRLALGTAALAMAAGAFQLGTPQRASAASPLTISGSMEGNLPVKPGDTLRAGYDFTMPGAHPSATVTVSGASVSLTVVCPDKSTVPLTITFPTYTVTDPAGSSQWLPSGDQSSSLVYQGSLVAPANLCGGAGGHAPQGATFTAQFGSTDTGDSVNVRFHYADNTAGSWSGTAHTTPGPPPPPPQTTLWVQTLDSCRQAIGGATFTLSDSSGNTLATQTAAPGGPKTVAQGGGCPIQGGDCVDTPIGCVSFTVDLPASGTETLTAAETAAPSGYVPCEGGSACQQEYTTFVIDGSGDVQATTTNVYPDGTVRTFPATDPNTGNAFWAATQSDPALVYDSSTGTASCDGDNDADDQNGSYPGSHCDNDGD